jgi:hypothetical protein
VVGILITMACFVPEKGICAVIAKSVLAASVAMFGAVYHGSYNIAYRQTHGTRNIVEEIAGHLIIYGLGRVGGGSRLSFDGCEPSYSARLSRTKSSIGIAR